MDVRRDHPFHVNSSPTEPLRLTGFVTFVTILLVVVIMRVGQDVIVPIALSVLLAFLLSPCVDRLARWGLPDTLAVGLTATLSFAVIAGLGWTVGTQAVAVLEELPHHEENIRAKISALKHIHAPGSLTRTTGMVESLKKEVAESAPAASPETPAAKTSRPPVAVEITEGHESPLQSFRDMLTPALGPLGTGGIVAIFVIAILFQRHDLRDRFLKLISAGRMNTATQAVDDAARRVSRYLGMQLLVNATYGIPVGIGLYLIGVPGAALWGLLATVLRFIPFLGPWIAAAFPLALAAAVDPGWSKLLYTAGLFVTLELISNNVVEVLVYGSSTGISSFALLVAAVFWTWLWGTAGLFLSTPLTVCLLVIGKYVPGLKFFSVLLGSEPALAPPTLFYQRMLSMNFDQLHELARRYVDERSLTAFYDDVFIPALIFAEEDRHSGALAEVRQRFIFQAGRELIEELVRDSDETTSAAASPGERPTAIAGILGLPVRDEADELVALMLQHVLRLRGISAEVSPITASPQDIAATIERAKIGITFISALPPAALVAARQVCRRLKAASPQVRLMAGIWSQQGHAGELKARFRDSKPDEVVTSLGGAVTYLENLVRGLSSPGPTTELAAAAPPAASPEDPHDSAPKPAPEEVYDRVIRDLAQVFEVPVSLVKLIDSDRSFWGSLPWFPADVDIARDALRESSVASDVTASPDLVLVEDIRKDRRFSGKPVLIERGICFYAGVPLRLRSGRMVGILCVIDTKERPAGANQVQALQIRAAELMEAIEANPPLSRIDQPGLESTESTLPLLLAGRS